MIYRIARMSSLVLAFGFLFSCSVLEDLTGDGETRTASQADENIREELRQIENVIESGDASTEAWYRKGVILQELAREEARPGPRQPLYLEMREALVQARSMQRQDEATTGTDEEIEELLKVSWSNEHNRGLRFSGADSSRAGEDPGLAVAHFQNAITIIPDSLSSYRLKAETHYRNGQPAEATATLEEARSRIDSLPRTLMEQLAWLHFEQENYESSIAVYREAGAMESGDRNLIHGLANAYMQAGRHEEAIPVLRQLADREPENLSYALSLGTELWFAGRAHITSAGEPPAGEPVYRQADSLFRRAEALYLSLAETSPENESVRRQFAHLCQNVSLLYREHASLEGAPDGLLREYINHYLTVSLPHLEYLAARERESGDGTYTRRLISVYTYLGMEQEAEALRDNSN